MAVGTYEKLSICVSDGVLATVTRGGVKELNEPTPAQQSSKPDANGAIDCYRKLQHGDLKDVDWRLKLAGMYVREMGIGRKDQKFILSSLPEGYVLWEHTKQKAGAVASTSKRDKHGRHGAGEYERQDAYLYGHPQGRKKRFRSPADFFPHLVWLTLDKDGDVRNCSCKICSPDGDQADERTLREPVRAEAPRKDVKPAPTPTITSAPKATISASGSILPPPRNIIAAATSALHNSKSTSSSSVSVLKTAQATRQPITKSKEQEADADPAGKYIYRPGEVVWFNNGPNWRLGVLSKRGLLNNRPRYLVQPLSNPMQHQMYQIKNEESDLRPWLAWSVPDTTIPDLRDLPFDTVPWDRIVSGMYDNGRPRDYVVDGSILAAKAIDASYSFFDRNETALVSPGEVHYNAMFLGAEKIWVGEPVRLKVTIPVAPATPDSVVMIIHKMIEHTDQQGRSSVTLVGDVYKFVKMPSPYKSRSDWPVSALPSRMAADLRFRNEVADQARTNTWNEWRLLEPAARKTLSDVKGRWYETRTLLPTLRGVEKFQEDIASGNLRDTGEWMNGRKDNNKVPETRRKNRRDTLGTSVPEDFKISRGLDGPLEDNLFPDQQQARITSGFDNENDLDQFMDLDQAAPHGFY